MKGIYDYEVICDTKTVPEKKWEFIAVIFANGEDDDLPGVMAALNGEKVQYGNKVHHPDESILIENATMIYKIPTSCNCICIERAGLPHLYARVGSFITFSNSFIDGSRSRKIFLNKVLLKIQR